MSSTSSEPVRQLKMRYRLFYMEKTIGDSVLNVLWGIYSHQKDKQVSDYKIFWGLLEIKKHRS